METLVNALADLDAYGVAFVSLRDNLDLSTPLKNSCIWMAGTAISKPSRL
jgi:hypothetical protein